MFSGCIHWKLIILLEVQIIAILFRWGKMGHPLRDAKKVRNGKLWVLRKVRIYKMLESFSLYFLSKRL